MGFVKKKLLNVTWDEIREALRSGDMEMEFELTDILEEASIYGFELENKISENIEYVLKREGLYDPEKMGGIVIPAGALHWECEEEGSCYYSAGFEVFDKTGRHTIAFGTAYGTMIPLDEDTMEIIDMTVGMPTGHVKRLKELVEKVRGLVGRIW